MIAVIFEVRPRADRKQEYLDLAAALRRRLDQADGFVSVERFQSLAEPGKILSLSIWRDEAAVTAWRRDEAHHAVQARGRAEVFEGYRLRVAAVLRDYGMTERIQAPEDAREFHGA